MTIKTGIYNELNDIRCDLTVEKSMKEIFRLKGIYRPKFTAEQYKAILMKMIIEKFGQCNISDYFLAIFGLQQGYDVDKKMAWRRKKLLLDIAEAEIDKVKREKKLVYAQKKDSPYNYARSVIHEKDRMEELAASIAAIEDIKTFSQDIDEYTMLIDGMIISVPPEPSYLKDKNLAEKKQLHLLSVPSQNNADVISLFSAGGIKQLQESCSLRTIDMLRTMSELEAKEVLDIFSFSTRQIVFNNGDGGIFYTGDVFPFALSGATIITEKKENSAGKDEKGLAHIEGRQKYELGLGRIDDYDFIILEELNLISRKENEEWLCLNKESVAFTFGFYDEFAVVIELTESSSYNYYLCYTAPVFLETAKDLYYMAKANAQLDAVIELLHEWRDTFEKIGEQKLRISLRKVTLLDEEYGFVDFEDEDLLETEYSRENIKKSIYSYDEFIKIHPEDWNPDDAIPFK